MPSLQIKKWVRPKKKSKNGYIVLTFNYYNKNDIKKKNAQNLRKYSVQEMLKPNLKYV